MSTFTQPPEISFQAIRINLGALTLLVSAEEDGIGERSVVVEGWPCVKDRDAGTAQHVRIVCRRYGEFVAVRDALIWAAQVAWEGEGDGEGR